MPFIFVVLVHYYVRVWSTSEQKALEEKKREQLQS